MSQAPKKKVVSKKGSAAATAPADGKKGTERVWTPTPEAKSQATTLRILAIVLWVLAIATEAVAIFWLLPMANEKLWPLLVALIPIAILALVGNLLWKKANRLDPASKQDKVRFFVQNQLGAFITVLAFLPLIILVLLDDKMDGKQKAIAGGIGAVVMLAVAATGVSWDGGPSQEQYAEEENIIVQLTGVDEVFWVKGGSVFHVCEAVPDVNKESKDNQIYAGTVADAHADGKDRLTKKWESEAINHCGYTQEDVDAVNAGLIGNTQDADTDAEIDAEDPVASDADTGADSDQDETVADEEE